MFDRVAVVSLERRTDRLDAFMSRVPKDWPFREIEVVRAIDGRLCKHPEWWRQGGGAWGCYRSHIRIIEEALNSGQESVLIFEDDAAFCKDFSKRAVQYFDALPADWIQAYVGGQHLKRPTEIDGNTLVVRANNVNRTHAYAVRGREGMTAVYRWLEATDKWVNRCHIDHHYGRLHASSSTGYYAPSQWLCGQVSGFSDIAWKEQDERWWLRKQNNETVDFPRADHCEVTSHQSLPVVSPKPGVSFVAVMGLHRSGSSCVAMMLHKLGVDMGDKLIGWESKNGGGGEAAGLAHICEQAARFPSAGFTHPRDQVKRNLRNWIQGRLAKSKKKKRLAGGKYPHLCAMGDMLRYICGDELYVIDCRRPFDESLRSLQERSRSARGWLHASERQCEQVQEWLSQNKQAFIDSMPRNRVFGIEHEFVKRSPEDAVKQLVEFLGIDPPRDAIRKAVGHVRK